MHATILGKPVSCLHNWRASKARPVSCTAPAARLRTSCSVQQEVRRSGNYQPTRWDFSYIQSLNSPYDKEKHLSRREELIVQVKILLQEEKMEHVQQLELIDDLKYLGLSYFFQDEIKEILALGFRVLRQHGFDVSQEVFDCFKNEEGSDFKENLAQDTKGILQLYEASFLLREGDDSLELARWYDLGASYLKEAKWYYSGYIPTLEEYMGNSKVSVASPNIISQLHFTLPNSSYDKSTIDSLYEYHDILYLSGMILRLADDVGTAQFELKRGDVQKAVQCYMNDTNASEKEAKEHVMSMLRELWKEMNTAMAAGHPFEDILAESAANLGRVAQFMYLEGDGHGVQHSGIHKQIAGLLLDPYA
ncbi:hypothetical protein SASPL_106254 [Salvia splendens]|uniref:Terpene synthase metal-binding domain-containing protein n=1 Tax=Salvia splendens TaxID=180675 RepID=A0A8X8YLH7_SALSN|nr:hypothetical protein SASPL_106254 [Salvia splendens]